MLEVMLGDRISLERTMFIDEPGLVELIRKGRVVEILALMEDGLINAVTELSSYGKVQFAAKSAKVRIDVFSEYFKGARLPVREDLQTSGGFNGEKGPRPAV